MLELDIALGLIEHSLLLDSILIALVDFRVKEELESLLLLVTWWEIVEGCKLNLFFRKSLSSPLNEVNDSRGNKVETLERLEVFLKAFFDSTSRVVEDELDRDRSSLVLGDK